MGTGGVASGPISFVEAHDTSTKTIKAGGKRRGANMGMLNVHHPDIKEWITCKAQSGDESYLEHFNLSVGITNEFMEALENNETIELRFDGKVVEHVGASYIWDLIVENAWKNGEPGVIFLDRLQEDNVIKDTLIEATNPCWTGDTEIWTIEGKKTFNELEGKEIEVLTKCDDGKLEFKMMRDIRKTRLNAEILEVDVKSANGEINTLRLTPDHNLYLTNGEKVMAKNLKEGDSLQSVYRYNANQKGYKRLSNKQTVQRRLGVLNHQVVEIRECTEREDVYNGTVDDIHRYFVFCGEDDAILSANCGDQPLLPNEACNLGSINLSKFVLSEHREKFPYDLFISSTNESPLDFLVNKASDFIDWDLLQKVVWSAVRFMDNIIDIAHFPLEKIDKQVRANRKIGLGVMAWSKLLLELGIPYDSNLAFKLGEHIMYFIDGEAHKASRALSKEKGTFPNWENSIYEQPIRNATLTTIAPTGTTSIFLGVGNYGGLEPSFSFSYEKILMDEKGEPNGETITYKDEVLKKVLKQYYMVYSDDLMEKIKDNGGSVQGVEGVPEDVQKIFKSALDIDPKAHIKMQSAFQKHTDNAVSKTINYPNDATIDDVEEGFKSAWELGCKGTTAYRAGSRKKEVNKAKSKNDIVNSKNIGLNISAKDINKKINEALEKLSKARKPEKRPRVAFGLTAKEDIGCGKLYITLNYDKDGNFIETFIDTGSNGGCRSMTETTSRLISASLRAGVDQSAILDQLDDVSSCSSFQREHGKYSAAVSILGSPESAEENGFRRLKGKSCASVIARSIR
jgi:ribonucleotide reductase alpha subunit